MLRLYNTRTRSVEGFTPLHERKVRIYVCGLTPSAEPHLGHARTFLFFDLFRRHLRHRGYDVTYVQNVTDIDDRSIESARAEGRPVQEIVAGYFGSFKSSLRRLGVAEPDVEPRATGYIPQILELIDLLVRTEHAYVTDDGIYFRVASFARYGALSGKQIDELMIGARIAENEKKRDPLDFALWKFEKPGEPSWPSGWKPGRPGWHIECSAMAHNLLGEPFDVHGGGTDLIFPHHENEIAQTESIFPQVMMANFWVHGGMLNFEQRKMSKSLGNYEPLYALLDRSDAQAIRLLFLQTGYRKPMNFTEESLAAATSAIGKLRKAFRVLAGGALVQTDATFDHDDIVRRVGEALDDDMNTAAALAVAFDVAARAEEYVRRGAARDAACALGYALTLLGIEPTQAWLREPKLDPSAAERIVAAIAKRNEARRNKDFALADRIRDNLAAERIELHDTQEGTTWTLAGD